MSLFEGWTIQADLRSARRFARALVGIVDDHVEYIVSVTVNQSLAHQMLQVHVYTCHSETVIAHPMYLQEKQIVFDV